MTGGYLIALTTGLLGSFGHCVGMCGPLAGTVTLAAPRRGGWRALAAPALYNAGRITTYGFIGFVMGLGGSFVNTAGRLAGLQDAVSVAAGALMIAMGLGAAGLSALARRLEQRVAGGVFAVARGVLEGGGDGRSYPLGLLLGFLPCGLSYSAFMAAAATGAPVRGALVALSFGAGTLPAMLAVGFATALAGHRLRGALYRAGGLLIAGMGILFVLRGLGVHAAL